MLAAAAALAGFTGGAFGVLATNELEPAGLAIGPREVLGELAGLGTGPREVLALAAAVGLVKGLLAAMGEEPGALGTGPFDAVGEEPGLAPKGLFVAAGGEPAALASGLLVTLEAAPPVFGGGSFPSGLLAVMGACPPAFAAGALARGLVSGLLAATGEAAAALGAGDLAASVPVALAAGVAAAGSKALVAAGFVGEEISALPVPVEAPAATPVFMGGVAELAVPAWLAAPAGAAEVSGFGLAAPVRGSAETSVSSTSENAVSRTGGLLWPPSGGLLPLVPSTRIAAPHDLHLIVTCFPRTLRL
ncbi:MAG TPA: hypothetical protein VI197_19710 [Polyangiaceae bacterium]